MSRVRSGHRTGLRSLVWVALAAVGVLVPLASGIAGRAPTPTPANVVPAGTQTRDAPQVGDTPGNLQAAFTNEMNARERYMAYAARADQERYPAVARLFRAFAKAESVHARRFVQAIALTGQPARALLERIDCAGTAENLQAALSNERYEIEAWYPGLIERARSDRQSMAVRSLTLAMATERGHVRLLEEALAMLEQRPLAGTLYVCPYCGRTTDTLEYRKCPGCYTSATRFLRPA